MKYGLTKFRLFDCTRCQFQRNFDNYPASGGTAGIMAFTAEIAYCHIWRRIKHYLCFNCGYVHNGRYILFCCWVPLIYKILLPFGHYFLYQYNIISRNYCLAYLAMVLLAVLYEKRHRYIWRYALSLLLFAESAAFWHQLPLFSGCFGFRKPIGRLRESRFNILPLCVCWADAACLCYGRSCRSIWCSTICESKILKIIHTMCWLIFPKHFCR